MSVRRGLLGLVLLAALVTYAWGTRRDLPVAPHGDEPTFVTAAVHMAATRSWNPGWFGHPGSTVIYPLSVFYKVRDAARDPGTLFRERPEIVDDFQARPAPYYWLGRGLSVTYAVLGIAATYWVGTLAFGETVGLAGAWLSIWSRISVSQGQLTRTDAAAVFFSMLALGGILRLADRATAASRFLTGALVGFAIGTRYQMAYLVPVLIYASRVSVPDARLATLGGVATGLAGVFAGFAVSTPYFFLEPAMAWANLSFEARQSHPGADGLSFGGNLWWYLSDVFPKNLGWVQFVFAACGLGFALAAFETKALLLVFFLATLLLGISWSPLHWERWAIQVLPPLSILAAHGLVRTVDAISSSLPLRRLMLGIGLALTTAQPLQAVLVANVRESRPSTRILAREWILTHLPPGSAIAVEHGAAALPADRFRVLERWNIQPEPFDYCAGAYRYLVVGGSILSAVFAEPARYPETVRSYRALLEKARPLAEIPWSKERAGPTVRIFELDCETAESD